MMKLIKSWYDWRDGKNNLYEIYQQGHYIRIYKNRELFLVESTLKRDKKGRFIKNN